MRRINERTGRVLLACLLSSDYAAYRRPTTRRLQPRRPSPPRSNSSNKCWRISKSRSMNSARPWPSSRSTEAERWQRLRVRRLRDRAGQPIPPRSAPSATWAKWPAPPADPAACDVPRYGASGDPLPQAAAPNATRLFQESLRGRCGQDRPHLPSARQRLHRPHRLHGSHALLARQERGIEHGLQLRQHSV